MILTMIQSIRFRKNRPLQIESYSEEGQWEGTIEVFPLRFRRKHPGDPIVKKYISGPIGHWEYEISFRGLLEQIESGFRRGRYAVDPLTQQEVSRDELLEELESWLDV